MTYLRQIEMLKEKQKQLDKIKSLGIERKKIIEEREFKLVSIKNFLKEKDLR